MGQKFWWPAVWDGHLGAIALLELFFKFEYQRLLAVGHPFGDEAAEVLRLGSRGEVIDPAALRTALQSGKLRVGLDVFDPEPADATGDFNDPLLDLPNPISRSTSSSI